MNGEEEVQGEDPGVGPDLVSRIAEEVRAGVVRELESKVRSLSARLAEAESELESLRGGSERRLYEVRVCKRGKVGDQESYSIPGPASGLTHLVVVRSDAPGAEELSRGLSGAVGESVYLVVVPHGAEFSVAELVPPR